MVGEVSEPNRVNVGDEAFHLVPSARAQQAASVLALQLSVVRHVQGVPVHFRHRDNLKGESEAGNAYQFIGFDVCDRGDQDNYFVVPLDFILPVAKMYSLDYELSRTA